MMIYKKNFPYFLVAFSIIAATMSFWFYQIFKSPNILTEKDAQQTHIYIRPEWKFSPQLLNTLVDQKIIHDGLSFAFIAKLKKYQENIKPGKYLMQPGWNNLQAIDYLKRGDQVPVRLTFNNILDSKDLPDAVCEGTLADPLAFQAIINDSTYLASLGFTKLDIIAMFLPDTYQVLWTYTAQELFDKMHFEYNRFWTNERKSKASSMGLSPKEIITLASIVYGESKNALEQPKIARIYLNRLTKGWPLQADPGWNYMRRHDINNDIDKPTKLHTYREVDSPFNLYMYKGLPPAPLQMPNKSAINAVLNAPSHDYMYIVSKGDGSGEHFFAKTMGQHNQNIQKYKRALEDN